MSDDEVVLLEARSDRLNSWLFIGGLCFIVLCTSTCNVMIRHSNDEAMVECVKKHTPRDCAALR